MYAISFVVLGFATYFIVNEAQKMAIGFDVAVVNEDDSEISNICFNIISNQDISDNITSFKKISLDEAKSGIAGGKYALAVVLKKGCIDDIRHGIKTNFDLYINEKYELINKIIKSLSENFAKMLIAGQYGVFSGEELIFDNIDKFLNVDYNNLYNQYIIKTNLNLISFVLKGKNKIFKNITLDYNKSNLSLLNFYIISFIIFILVVGKSILYGFYRDDYYVEMIDRIKFYKITANEYYFGKIILPLIAEVPLIIILLIILKIKFSLLFLFALLLGLILLNIYTILCAYLVKNKYNYIVWILLIISLFTFLNGGILPRSMLPQKLLEVIFYTPYGVVFSLLASFINNILSIKVIILAFTYILLSYLFLTRIRFEDCKFSS